MFDKVFKNISDYTDMGLFDKIKKGVGEAIESATALAKMDDFLIKKIDEIISLRWEKVAEKRPLSIGGISLEEEAEYKYVYKTDKGQVKVELEHEFPYVEIEMTFKGYKLERKIKVSDFVEKEGFKLYLRNEEELRRIVNEIMDDVLH